jgi:hypothetical protein
VLRHIATATSHRASGASNIAVVIHSDIQDSNAQATRDARAPQ